MEINPKPKLGGKNVLQLVYSTPELEKIGWTKSLVAMCKATCRYFRENVKFGTFFNDATLTENIAYD
jgi:hypothetical protein